MPPKHKVQNLSAGEKSAEKKFKKSTISPASETCEKGGTGTKKVGKNKFSKKTENFVVPKVKMETLSPEFVKKFFPLI